MKRKLTNQPLYHSTTANLNKKWIQKYKIWSSKYAYNAFLSNIEKVYKTKSNLKESKKHVQLSQDPASFWQILTTREVEQPIIPA